MAVTRKLIAHDDNINQWLKVDHSSRFIQNSETSWQFLFGFDSTLSSSNQVVKIGAKFDEDTFENLKITAYLYDQKNKSIANGSSCSIKISRVTTPDWSEVEITTINATQLPNFYFYSNPLLSSFTGVDLDGAITLLIEVSIFRLGIYYNERVYINHLGIYDSLDRLTKEVDYLAITKKDE